MILHCLLLEGMLKALEDKSKDSVAEEQKPEPRTETLYLCTYEGCGKAFIEFGALKKHTHIHGERQHVCQYEGCGKVIGSPFTLFWLLSFFCYFVYHSICWSKPILKEGTKIKVQLNIWWNFVLNLWHSNCIFSHFLLSHTFQATLSLFFVSFLWFHRWGLIPSV